jgi:hypothetical protein
MADSYKDGMCFLFHGKAIPVTGREGQLGCETSRLPHVVYTIGSQMAVRLSALRAGRPLHPGNIPGTHFC